MHSPRSDFIKEGSQSDFKQQIQSIETLGNRSPSAIVAGFEEAEVSPRRKPFSSKEMQMASRFSGSWQVLLQGKVLWNKEPPVHSDVARHLLLYSAMPVLLESAE